MKAKSLAAIAAVLLVIVIAGVFGYPWVKEEIAYIRAMEAYAYGFPLVITELTRQVETAVPTAGELAAPVNQFSRVRGYIPWDFKNVVRVSFNSLWSWAALDLRQEPVVFSFPDNGGVPDAFRLVNEWTDVFGTGGSRQPEANAGDYLIAGPGWHGTPPPNVKKVFQAATGYAWVIVEMAASSSHDFAKIHTLQNRLAITPLSKWGTDYRPPASVPVDSNVDLSATPYDQVRLMTGEQFFKQLALMMRDNPPYPADADMIAKLKKLGVEPGRVFEPEKLDPAVRKGINRAPFAVWNAFYTGPFTMKNPNGWSNMLNIGRFGTDYSTRAFVAYFGLGAGVKEDIVYPTTFTDADGSPLDGAYSYVAHFTKADMALAKDGVWSLSAYRENFYVYNSPQRYGLPPGHPTYNADGSLDIYVQAKSPGEAKEANWLPSPATGMFNLTLRIYNPAPEALNPAHVFPAVTRIRTAFDQKGGS